MAVLSYDDAAHLLRRAGFSGTMDEIEVLAGKDRESAVASLLDYERIDNQGAEDKLKTSFPFLQLKSVNDLNDTNLNETELRAWWISRMFFTRRPFEEKMTLFWHNYFATAVSKVPPVHMYAQNLDLRQYALARFDDLLLKISQGAAMLIWLDGVSNTKANPNENFAREIQEVFSMGTHDLVTGEPNYSETDVKEIARAFTGWKFRKKTNDNSPFTYEWYVDSEQADRGAKTIYGQTATYTGEDVVSIISQRRSTARYLVNRIFEFFVYPLDLTSATDKATLDKFADIYLAKDHSIKELMRAVLTSDEFFSARARFALIKTPVEFIVGAVKMLRGTFIPGSLNDRDLTTDRFLRDMGMDLFNPPDVFGWKMNLGFINSRAMLERVNFPDQRLFPRTNFTDPGPLIDYNFMNSQMTSKPNTTVKALLYLFGPLQVDDATFDVLEHYLTVDYKGAPIKWKKYQKTFSGVAKKDNIIRLIMCLPEFQLK